MARPGFGLLKNIKSLLIREPGKTSTIKPVKVFYEETVFLLTSFFWKRLLLTVASEEDVSFKITEMRCMLPHTTGKNMSFSNVF